MLKCMVSLMYFPYSALFGLVVSCWWVRWQQDSLWFYHFVFLEDAGRELPPKIDPFKVFLVDIRVFSQWVLLVKALLSVISYQMNNIDIITWGVLRRRGNRRLHSGILRGGHVKVFKGRGILHPWFFIYDFLWFPKVPSKTLKLPIGHVATNWLPALAVEPPQY